MCQGGESLRDGPDFRATSNSFALADTRKKLRGAHFTIPANFDPTHAEARSKRLRALIECSVAAGLVPPASALAKHAVNALPLKHPCRGGSEIAFARQVAMYLAHVGCGLTYTQAAALYARDRTTAAHACRLVEERRDNPAFDRILGLLEACVHAGLRQIEPNWPARQRRF